MSGALAGLLLFAAGYSPAALDGGNQLAVLAQETRSGLVAPGAKHARALGAIYGQAQLRPAGRLLSTLGETFGWFADAADGYRFHRLAALVRELRPGLDGKDGLGTELLAAERELSAALPALEGSVWAEALAANTRLSHAIGRKRRYTEHAGALDEILAEQEPGLRRAALEGPAGQDLTQDTERLISISHEALRLTRGMLRYSTFGLLMVSRKPDLAALARRAAALEGRARLLGEAGLAECGRAEEAATQLARGQGYLRGAADLWRRLDAASKDLTREAVQARAGGSEPPLPGLEPPRTASEALPQAHERELRALYHLERAHALCLGREGLRE